MSLEINEEGARCEFFSSSQYETKAERNGVAALFHGFQLIRVLILIKITGCDVFRIRIKGSYWQWA